MAAGTIQKAKIMTRNHRPLLLCSCNGWNDCLRLLLSFWWTPRTKRYKIEIRVDGWMSLPNSGASELHDEVRVRVVEEQ